MDGDKGGRECREGRHERAKPTDTEPAHCVLLYEVAVGVYVDRFDHVVCL